MQAFGEYSDDGTASAMKARDYKDATDLVAEKKSHWDGSDVHPTINQSYKKSGGIGYSNQELFSQGGCGLVQSLYENHPNDSRVTGPHEVAPSCVSRFGTGGGNVPLVQAVDVYNQTIDGDVAATLTEAVGGTNTSGAKVLAVDCYNKTINEKSQAISSSASDINHTGGVIDPRQRMAVRRLTPKECERLQGFPDEHTLIPWRNKPADQCPDGPRYKALGNSMAVPCMRWIGERIDKCQREQ